jgi:hypothetical protein
MGDNGKEYDLQRLQAATDMLAAAADAVALARSAICEARRIAADMQDPELARSIAQTAGQFKLDDGGFYPAER